MTDDRALAAKIAWRYALGAGLWIVLSEAGLLSFAREPAVFSVIQLLKGMGFVVVTALLLQLMLARAFRRHSAAEADRHAHAARYQLLADHTKDSILFVRAADGRIAEANQAAVEAYGYSHDELLSLTISDLRAPETRAQVAEQLARSAEGLRFETAHRRRDGSAFPVEVSTAGASIDGEPVRISVIRDISERRDSAARLQLLQAALEATANAVVITDTSGNIQWVNPAYTRLTGYTPAEALGQNPRLLKSGLHPPTFYQELWGTIRAGQVWNGELINRRKDGRLYHEEQTITPVRASGGAITHFIAIKQDVTARVARAREQAALATMASALRTAMTRAELLPVLLEQTMMLLSAHGAALALRDPSTDETVFELGAGSWSGLTGVRLPPGSSVSGRVLTTGEPYRSDDVHADPTFVRPELLGAARAGAGVPLRAPEALVGVLWVARADPIDDAELRMLQAIADLAGSALHRAILYEQTAQRLRRLSSLHAIDVAIAASLDLRLTLGIVLEQVLNQLGVDAAAVLLLDLSRGQLRYRAGQGFRTNLAATTPIPFGEGLIGEAVREQRMVRVPLIPVAGDNFARGALLSAEGFVAYFAAPLIAKGQVVGVLELFQRTPRHPDAEWLHFFEVLAGQTAIAVDSAELFARLQRTTVELSIAYDATLEGWARALDLRDNDTQGHSRRVTDLTVELARSLGVGEAELVHMRRGALLHDIGKMGVPDAILRKPGPLTEAEWVEMRRHPDYAAQLLAPIAFLRPALVIPRYHHERWDGSGYPMGLRSTQIPMAARIFAVVDVWDALTNDRPYRDAWPPAQARAYLAEQAGVGFDPQVVTAFLQLIAARDDERLSS